MRLQHFAGALAVAGLMLAAGQAFAQAAAPATPAADAPAAGGASIGGAGAPMHVDLTPVEPQWTKLCGPDQSQANKQTCLVSRDFSQGQQPTLSLAVNSTDGVDKHTARFLLPNGMLLRPGFRVIFDKSEPIDGRYSFCFPAYCFADIDFGAPTLALMKKAQVMNVVLHNANNIEVTLSAPMKDFGTAYDGPAIDPKVLQQQQAELQKQLLKQQEEQRAALEQQSQKGLAPAPAPLAPPPAK